MPQFLQEIVRHSIPAECDVEIVAQAPSIKDASLLAAKTGADVIVIAGGLTVSTEADATQAVCGQPVMPIVIGIKPAGEGAIVSYEWTVKTVEYGALASPQLVNAILSALRARSGAGRRAN